MISKFDLDYLKDELEASIEKLDVIIQRYILIKGTLHKNREDILKVNLP